MLISLKIPLCPEAFLCPKLGNCLFQIQGVSELLWCIKLSYFAENRWCPNINGVRKYIVNTVVFGARPFLCRYCITALLAILSILQKSRALFTLTCYHWHKRTKWHIIINSKGIIIGLKIMGEIPINPHYWKSTFPKLKITFSLHFISNDTFSILNSGLILKTFTHVKTGCPA